MNSATALADNMERLGPGIFKFGQADWQLVLDALDKMATATARGDVQRCELTKDPVFLLQSAHMVVADEGYFRAAEELADDGELSQSDEEDLLARGLARLVWDTESVWYTRKEAEDFRVGHAYRWPTGSRVYCVPACGELAERLA
jgi:hypothetical protein